MDLAGSAEDAALIKRCIEDAAKDGKNTLDPQLLKDVIAIIQGSGSLEYTRQLANAEADKALALLATLNDSPYRRALEDMARFSVQRST